MEMRSPCEIQTRSVSKESDELKKIIHRFKERATLPAVSVMQQKISIFWRTVWILVVLCGIVVSIYQSIELIENYLRYPTFLTDTEMVNNTVLFPSVTLCSQNLIDWKRIRETNHSILHVIERAAKEKVQENAIDRRAHLEELLMEELHRLDWDERQEFLYKPDEWLKLCYILSVTSDVLDCLKNLSTTEIYSPYYGPCITINSGLDEATRLRESSKSRIIIRAEFPRELEFPYMARNDGILVSIHAPGTAPVVQFNKFVEVLPGEWLHASMNVFDIKRLPAPFASNCSSDESPLSRDIYSYSSYQSNTTRYSYSREECMATCFFWETINKKSCINPFTASKKDMKFPYNLCSSHSVDIEFVERSEIVCTESCQKRCRELWYDWTPMTMGIPQHKGFLYDMLYLPTDKSSINLDEMVLITLRMETTVYLYREETAKYELEDVFGAVGGNLGLWIGVSILTVFEVFELIASLLVYFIKKLFFCCFKTI